MPEIMHTKTEDVSSVLKQCAYLSGVSANIEEEEFIIVADFLQRGNWRQITPEQILEAFAMYSEGVLPVKEKFVFSLKLVGDVLTGWKEAKRKQKAKAPVLNLPETKQDKEAREKEQLDQDRQHFDRITQYAKQNGSLPDFALYVPAYRHALRIEVIEAPGKERLDKIKAEIIEERKANAKREAKKIRDVIPALNRATNGEGLKVEAIVRYFQNWIKSTYCELRT